ncbi:MAG: sulfatase-like hydrolase/transferase [Phycisphaerae bacterium]
MRTRLLYAGFCLLSAAIGACDRAAAPEKRADGHASRPPNIIVIVSDDQAARTLGVDGNAHIRTPCIDRLAAEGAFFARAYVPLPQCAPSRAAMLTGRYPHRLGVLTNVEGGVPADAATIAQVLRPSGYRCGLIGKWHLGDESRQQGGFDDAWIVREHDPARAREKYTDPVLLVNGVRRQEKGYLTDILTQYAIEFVRASDKRPCFLWLAHFSPHEPLAPPPDSRHAYSPADVPLPASISDDLSGKPAQQRRSACHAEFERVGLPEVRWRCAQYYSMISALDENVGRLVDALRADGRERDTIVFYLSDNGWLNGEHQLHDKGPFFYDELIRTPLIAWAPGRIKPGQRIGALVSSIDLLPTIAGLAGVAAPAGVDGVDFWPLVAGSKQSVRDELYLVYAEKLSSAEFEPMLGVVTSRHKYSRYMSDGAEELYDLAADPFELRNLVAAAESAAALGDLRARVDRFAAGFQDPFWLHPPTQPSGEDGGE